MSLFFETLSFSQDKIERGAYHQKRINQTLSYLQLPTQIDNLPLVEWFEEYLPHTLKQQMLEAARIDFVLTEEQKIISKVEARKKLVPSLPLKVAIDYDHPRLRGDRKWNYKLTSDQHDLAKLRENLSGCDDLILLNELGRLCEATRFNIYIVEQNNLLTPPLEEGVLNGTFRAWLLDQKEITLNGQCLKIIEQPLAPNDLSPHSLIYLSNALRGLLPAKLVS